MEGFAGFNDVEQNRTLNNHCGPGVHGCSSSRVGSGAEGLPGTARAGPPSAGLVLVQGSLPNLGVLGAYPIL